jgi:hypothetical protein
VPPEKATVADRRGRLGSGCAYDGGQAAGEGDAAGELGAPLAAVVKVVVLSVVMVMRDGPALEARVGGAAADELQAAAASAAATTHPVRMPRR